MSLGIFDIMVIVMGVVIIAYGLYRSKVGPTEKERAKLEAKYGRVLTEDDIKSYKRSQKIWGIVLTVALVIIVISKLWV